MGCFGDCIDVDESAGETVGVFCGTEEEKAEEEEVEVVKAVDVIIDVVAEISEAFNNDGLAVEEEQGEAKKDVDATGCHCDADADCEGAEQ